MTKFGTKLVVAGNGEGLICGSSVFLHEGLRPLGAGTDPNRAIST